MGSTLSSQPDQHKGYSQFEAAKRAYNNNDRVVLIPIDESKQAEKAFECEYPLKLFYFRFISVININIYIIMIRYCMPKILINCLLVCF